MDYYYLLSKHCTRQCTSLPLSGSNQLLTIKIQQQIAGLSACFGQEKRRIEQFSLFFGFAFKCYKFSCFNDSEDLQNVTQFH